MQAIYEILAELNRRNRYARATAVRSASVRHAQLSEQILSITTS